MPTNAKLTCKPLRLHVPPTHLSLLETTALTGAGLTPTELEVSVGSADAVAPDMVAKLSLSVAYRREQRTISDASSIAANPQAEVRGPLPIGRLPAGRNTGPTLLLQGHGDGPEAVHSEGSGRSARHQPATALAGPTQDPFAAIRPHGEPIAANAARLSANCPPDAGRLDGRLDGAVAGTEISTS